MRQVFLVSILVFFFATLCIQASRSSSKKKRPSSRKNSNTPGFRARKVKEYSEVYKQLCSAAINAEVIEFVFRLESISVLEKDLDKACSKPTGPTGMECLEYSNLRKKVRQTCEVNLSKILNEMSDFTKFLFELSKEALDAQAVAQSYFIRTSLKSLTRLHHEPKRFKRLIGLATRKLAELDQEMNSFQLSLKDFKSLVKALKRYFQFAPPPIWAVEDIKEHWKQIDMAAENLKNSCRSLDRWAGYLDGLISQLEQQHNDGHNLA